MVSGNFSRGDFVGFNLLIFTGENLIFLLSPYRRNQEGLDVFILTVLTFTGKGIVFAVAVSALLFWATLSVLIVSSLGLSAGWRRPVLCWTFAYDWNSRGIALGWTGASF